MIAELRRSEKLRSLLQIVYPRTHHCCFIRFSASAEKSCSIRLAVVWSGGGTTWLASRWPPKIT